MFTSEFRLPDLYLFLKNCMRVLPFVSHRSSLARTGAYTEARRGRSRAAGCLQVATAGCCGLTDLLIVHIFVGTRHVNDLIADAVSGVRTGRATTPVPPRPRFPTSISTLCGRDAAHQTLKSSRKSLKIQTSSVANFHHSMSQTTYLVTKSDLPIWQEEKGTNVQPESGRL